MTTKSESVTPASENGAKHEVAAKHEDAGKIDDRQRLLARVAGNVASGIVTAPTKSTSTAEKIASVAVDIAEAILKKVGL
jgi:hypothetical protein